MKPDFAVEILRAEVARLRSIETQYDLLQGEMEDLRLKLNAIRMEAAQLKDSLEGMTTDMSLMEDTIRELSGQEPDGDGGSFGS